MRTRKIDKDDLGEYTAVFFDPTDRQNPMWSLLNRPIAYHRIFVDVTGSIEGAVFLSQALYWSLGRTTLAGGWFYKTREDWEEETGLNRRQQESARKSLRKFPWWREGLSKANGVPTMHYRLDLPLFQEYLFREFQTTVPVGTNQPNPLVRNRTNPNAQSVPTLYTETTSKTTTESLTTPLPPPAAAKGADATTSDPAVKVYQQVWEKYPDKFGRDLIIAHGIEDLTLWMRVCTYARASNWKIKNYRAMLEVYDDPSQMQPRKNGKGGGAVSWAQQTNDAAKEYLRRVKEMEDAQGQIDAPVESTVRRLPDSRHHP